MHCSNAGLLALWLILCTQGHEDFNLSSWHCRCECVRLLLCVRVYAFVCPGMCMCLHLFVCFLLFLHFTFTKSPILMSCHRQLLPTLALTLQDGGGQSVLLCAFVCIKMGREDYQNVQKQTQDVHCGLSGPLCAQIFLCMLLQHPLRFCDSKKKNTCWTLKRAY